MISTFSPASVTLLSIGETPACINTVCSPTIEIPSGKFNATRVLIFSWAFCRSSGCVSTTPGRLLTSCGSACEDRDNRRKNRNICKTIAARHLPRNDHFHSHITISTLLTDGQGNMNRIRRSSDPIHYFDHFHRELQRAMFDRNSRGCRSRLTGTCARATF